MSDSRVEIAIDTPADELSFEEYFVQRWYQDPVNSVRFAGASDAEPAPGVIDAHCCLPTPCPDRSQQSHHEHRPDPGCARDYRSTAARARKGRRHQPHCRQCAGGRPGGHSAWPHRISCPSSIAGVAQAYEDFLRRADLRHADAVAPPRRTLHQLACACSALKSSCAARKTKLRWRA